MPVWKTPAADVKRQYPLFIQIGLVAALVLLVAAFTVPMGGGNEFEIVQTEQEIVQVEEIEQTQQFVPPPPPPPAPPPPVEVPDEQVIEQEIIIPDADLDLNEAPPAPPPPPPPPPPPQQAAPPPPPEPEPEPEPEVFVVVEQMPELIGGLESLRPEYPEMERRAGVEGRVFLQFIVNEDGSVSEVTVTRGVSPGLDRAAVEAVRRARFRPGMQRGRPVKVRFSLPVNFRLTGG